jgi:hypothetical protein
LRRETVEFFLDFTEQKHPRRSERVGCKLWNRFGDEDRKFFFGSAREKV